jgi:hypothetical protein
MPELAITDISAIGEINNEYLARLTTSFLNDSSRPF